MPKGVRQRFHKRKGYNRRNPDGSTTWVDDYRAGDIHKKQRRWKKPVVKGFFRDSVTPDQ